MKKIYYRLALCSLISFNASAQQVTRQNCEFNQFAPAVKAEVLVQKMIENSLTGVVVELGDQRGYDIDLSDVRSVVTTECVRQQNSGDEDIQAYDITGYKIYIESKISDIDSGEVFTVHATYGWSDKTGAEIPATLTFYGAYPTEVEVVSSLNKSGTTLTRSSSFKNAIDIF